MLFRKLKLKFEENPVFYWVDFKGECPFFDKNELQMTYNAVKKMMHHIP